MKTNKTPIYILLAIALGLVICFLSYTSFNRRAASAESVQDQRVTTPSPGEAKPIPSAETAAWMEKRAKEIQDDQQKGLNEWRTQIDFYGQIIDENANPVAGADVHFQWTDLSPKGTSSKQTVSDANGLFSLHSERGKNLLVQVSKLGYYSYRRFGASFSYAGENQNFVPSASNPVVFRLKRKGVAEPLVHIEAPMGGPKGFKIARDGTPLEISLVTGKAVPLGQGDLRVECQTSVAFGQKYDWKCQVSVPNGGLKLSTNDLEFQAPPDGYQSSDVIDMPANLEAAWSNHAQRAYFVKLPNGNYARMNLEMVAGGDHFFQIESFLNPSGSRNLEFDPAKEVK